jgi:hypothetical protein
VRPVLLAELAIVAEDMSQSRGQAVRLLYYYLALVVVTLGFLLMALMRADSRAWLFEAPTHALLGLGIFQLALAFLGAVALVLYAVAFSFADRRRAAERERARLVDSLLEIGSRDWFSLSGMPGDSRLPRVKPFEPKAEGVLLGSYYAATIASVLVMLSSVYLLAADLPAVIPAGIQYGAAAFWAIWVTFVCVGVPLYLLVGYLLSEARQLRLLSDTSYTADALNISHEYDERQAQLIESEERLGHLPRHWQPM